MELLILVLGLLAPALAVTDDVIRIILDSKKSRRHKDHESEDS